MTIYRVRYKPSAKEFLGDAIYCEDDVPGTHLKYIKTLGWSRLKPQHYLVNIDAESEGLIHLNEMSKSLYDNLIKVVNDTLFRQKLSKFLEG